MLSTRRHSPEGKLKKRGRLPPRLGIAKQFLDRIELHPAFEVVPSDPGVLQAEIIRLEVKPRIVQRGPHRFRRSTVELHDQPLVDLIRKLPETAARISDPTPELAACVRGRRGGSDD